MQQQKKFCSLKKIKTLRWQKQSDDEDHKSSGSPSKMSMSPPKFLDPFPYYIIASDLVIFDNMDKLGEKFISPTNILFNKKYIVSIDALEDHLLINFEEKTSYLFTPLPFLASRLRSLNSQTHYELSNVLEGYQNFWDVLLKVQNFGGNREILDSLNPSILITLQQYYHQQVRKSIEEENLTEFIKEYLKKRESKSIFCLIYGFTDHTYCMHITGVLINNTLKKLISRDDLEYTSGDFIYSDTYDYLDCCMQTMKNYFCDRPGDTFEFMIKAKDGLRRMRFQLEKFFVNLKKGGKKVLVFLTEIPKKLPIAENRSHPKKNNKMEVEEEEKPRKSKKETDYESEWKNLVGLYFGEFSEEKGGEEK